MRRYPYRTMAVWVVVAFLALGSSFFYHLTYDDVWNLFREEEIFRNLLNAYNGYFSAGTHIYVLSLICMIAVEYCLKKEEILFLLRTPGRRSFYFGRLKATAVIILLVSALYYLIGFGGIGLFIDKKYIFCFATAIYVLVAYTMTYLYLFRLAVFYLWMRDIAEQKIPALLGTMGLAVSEFFIDGYVFSGIYFPYEDLYLAEQVYTEARFLPLPFFFALARQIGLLLFIGLIGLRCFVHKDVIQLEK